MSAPSATHEERVALLADVASLAGYTVEATVCDARRPDVVRLHPARPALFIADGKATESPDDPRTRARLAYYGRAARIWLRGEFAVSVAICHGADPGRAWLRCLAEVADASGSWATDSRSVAIDDSWISMVTLREKMQCASRPGEAAGRRSDGRAKGA